MRRRKQERGITLIALIITIVVLLILAVVAINSIQNEDIIAHVSNSAGTYNNSVTNEQSILSEYEEFLKQHSCTEHNFENGVCSKCGYKCEEHNWVNGVCAVCNKVACSHDSWSFDSYIREGTVADYCQAVGYCYDCEQYVIKKEEHEFNSGACTKCGYDDCNHEITETKYSYDSCETCIMTTSCKTCRISLDTQGTGHNYVDGVCTNCKGACGHECCGLSEVESYKYGDEYSCVGTGTCSDCGLKGATHDYEHDWSYGEWTANGMEGCSTTRTCSQCKHTQGVTENHSWDASLGACSKCGQECQHNWVEGGQYGGYYCDICGAY